MSGRIRSSSAIRSRDNSGRSRVIKQPHTLKNYRNGQESGNKETTRDKRTERKSRSMLRAVLLSLSLSLSFYLSLFLFILRFDHATDDDSASFDPPPVPQAARFTYSTIVTFLVQIVTIDRTDRRIKRAWRRRIIDPFRSAGSVAGLTRTAMNP